jgi:DNA-binding transcriptional LysR family regulator
MTADLRQLRSFVTIVRCGNFTRAAQQLGLSQPALSLSLRQLEAALGLRLLDRTTRSVGLTTDGLRLLPTAERLLIDFDAAIRDVKESAVERSSVLTVGCLMSLAVCLLPKAIAKFQRERSDITIKIIDGAVGAVLRAIRQGEAEIGFSSYWQAQPDLEFRPLAEDRFVLVCRSDHRLAKQRQVSWSALKEEPFLLLTRDTGLRRYLDEAFGDLITTVKPAFEVGTWASLGGLLGAGLGVTALPELATPSGFYGDLKQIPLVDPVIKREVGLVTRVGARLSPAAQSFVAIVESQLHTGAHRQQRRRA